MKKISQIVAYVLLSAVVVSFVLMAIIKKDFAPEVNIPSYEQRLNGVTITIKDSQDNDLGGLSSQNKENYNKFVNAYNDSYKLTLLYSIFSGKISRKQQVTNFGSSNPKFESGYVIKINFDKEQVLKSNGVDFIESSNIDQATKYNMVLFNVGKELGLKICKIYFKSGESYYKLETLANFDELYTVVDDLFGTKEE